MCVQHVLCAWFIMFVLYIAQYKWGMTDLRRYLDFLSIGWPRAGL